MVSSLRLLLVALRARRAGAKHPLSDARLAAANDELPALAYALREQGGRLPVRLTLGHVSRNRNKSLRDSLREFAIRYGGSYAGAEAVVENIMESYARWHRLTEVSPLKRRLRAQFDFLRGDNREDLDQPEED